MLVFRQSMEVYIDCHMENDAHAKCTKQFVRTATKNVKFPSNQTKVDQSTVENVGPREEDQEEDTKGNHYPTSAPAKFRLKGCDKETKGVKPTP